jgi:hypothetical protein
MAAVNGEQRPPAATITLFEALWFFAPVCHSGTEKDGAMTNHLGW